jgi:DNA invertase Pin-like site-specific DNA recombinase
MTKVIGYCRVSTDGQAVEGVSLDAQRAQIEAWAAARGAELVGVFVDAGVSGKRADNRVDLQQALAVACRTRGVLVVYSLSRLARSTRDAIEIAERLRKARANLVSLTESIDTTTAAGKMVFTLFAAFAQFERDLTSERTSAALRYKRARGERVSRHAPYGWRLGEDSTTLVPDAAEQAAVARARALRGSGLSLQQVANALAMDGVLARNGRPFAPKVILGITNRPVSNAGGAEAAA